MPDTMAFEPELKKRKLFQELYFLENAEILQTSRKLIFPDI